MSVAEMSFSYNRATLDEWRRGPTAQAIRHRARARAHAIAADGLEPGSCGAGDCEDPGRGGRAGLVHHRGRHVATAGSEAKLGTARAACTALETEIELHVDEIVELEAFLAEAMSVVERLEHVRNAPSESVMNR